jgi:hypothetical protein
LTETSAVSTVPTPTGVRPPSREIALPTVVGARYRLEEIRGGGGMAKVYRAVDLTLEREVAVKLINADLRTDPEFDARFQREARIASQLQDPHIIKVHDYGFDPELGPFLVMEYLQGQSLRERLQAGGPLPLKAGIQLSAQMLLALIHAHGKNIVHRDIKPDNVFLLNQSGVRLHVNVLDFGIARILRHDHHGGDKTLTHPGAVLGTPRYMSPEQLAGQPVDARSDVYSAALVIHEALTGHLPYVSGKLTELCPDATPALQDLLDQCLKPNPAERPPSAVEVYLRLQELGKASGILLLPPGAMDRLIAARQSGEPTRAYVPGGGERKPAALPWWRRRSVQTAVLALALIAVTAGGWWLSSRGDPVHDPQDAETLLDVKIGDGRQEVVDKLHLTNAATMNPWAGDKPSPYVGHVLRAEDLDVPDTALAKLSVEWTEDKCVCAIFYQDKLRAVIVRQPHKKGKTGRGLHVLGSVADLYRLYDEEPTDTSSVKLDAEESKGGSSHGEVRRHDDLGIGFMTQKDKITAITLYPVKKK